MVSSGTESWRVQSGGIYHSLSALCTILFYLNFTFQDIMLHSVVMVCNSCETEVDDEKKIFFKCVNLLRKLTSQQDCIFPPSFSIYPCVYMPGGEHALAGTCVCVCACVSAFLQLFLHATSYCFRISNSFLNSILFSTPF